MYVELCRLVGSYVLILKEPVVRLIKTQIHFSPIDILSYKFSVKGYLYLQFTLLGKIGNLFTKTKDKDNPCVRIS